MSERRREPVFNIPVSITAILAGLFGVHLMRLSVSTGADIGFVGWLAFVPIRLTALFEPVAVAQRVASWTAGSSEQANAAEIARFFLSGSGWGVLPTLLTYALLHGSWTHLGLNAVWLLAFGTPVARRFGPLRFLVFFAVSVVAGAATHWALFPFGAEPLIGASAGVSGCMGAAVRFAFRTPRERDGALGVFPDESLGATLRDRRALAFILVWFATNALFGAGSAAFGFSDQPVAWQAHIGGFLVGLLLFPVFAPPPAPASELDPPDGPPLAP